jgi:uncharacterized protein YajQ (UPF0234 family)
VHELLTFPVPINENPGENETFATSARVRNNILARQQKSFTKKQFTGISKGILNYLRSCVALALSPTVARSPFKIIKAMPDNSFDIVSEVDMPEVVNAVQQAIKEITTRFDLKDSKSSIELKEKDKKIELTSSDEFKIKAVGEILAQKLVKRKVPTKNLTFEKIEQSGSRVKQEINLQVGIPIEKARDIVKKIKDSKLKVQAAIQGEVVRVSGKDRDTLQQAMALLRGADFGLDLQFTNYRSN